MKQYKKYAIVAKNRPTGSYAAGCPAKGRDITYGRGTCLNCERTA